MFSLQYFVRLFRKKRKLEKAVIKHPIKFHKNINNKCCLWFQVVGLSYVRLFRWWRDIWIIGMLCQFSNGVVQLHNALCCEIFWVRFKKLLKEASWSGLLPRQLGVLRKIIKVHNWGPFFFHTYIVPNYICLWLPKYAIDQNEQMQRTAECNLNWTFPRRSC